MIGAEVIGGDIDAALRFLKRAIGKDGVHKMVKRRLDYAKPSLRRKAKAAVAERRRVTSEIKKRRFLERQYERTKRSSPQDLRQRTLETLAADAIK